MDKMSDHGDVSKSETNVECDSSELGHIIFYFEMSSESQEA